MPARSRRPPLHRIGPFRYRHPAQLVVATFALIIGLSTLVLALPIARAGTGTGGAPFVTALFTATSAVCVTGLIVVDTAGYWSSFGEAAILVMIQVGGFGIMTLASLLALFVYRNLGVWGRVLAQAETKALDLGDVRRVLLGVAVFSLAFEALTAVLLTGRLVAGYEVPLGRAVYLGIFHAVSAFNNAGFALFEDNLIRFVSDWWFVLSIAGAVIIGGIGFPVLVELWRARRNEAHRPRWSLHTKLTLAMTAALLLAGAVMVMALEWTNPLTLGHLSTPSKLLSGVFQGLTPRTAGFNTLDYEAMRETTWLGTMILMFIGGGSASTAGGVKVTTIALLAAMVYAEARGEPTVELMGRRIPGPAQRQALSVVVAAAVAVVVGAFFIMAMSEGALAPSLFEAVSAFGTVGLSTGITPELSSGGRLILVALMFAGRVGPITLGAALAMREHRRLYRLPEERPIVG